MVEIKTPTQREFVVSLIAGQLGIPVSEVKDELPLGERAPLITKLVCLHTRCPIQGSTKMTAGDLLRQV